MTFHPHIKNRSQGLTTVEFIVVLVVLVALVVVLWPSYGHDHRLARNLSNMREIGLALTNYAFKHDGVLPEHPKDALDVYDDGPEKMYLVQSAYRDNRTVSDKDESMGPALRYGDCVFLNLGTDLDDIRRPAEEILAYAVKVSSDQKKRGVLFVDGHVVNLDEKEFLAILPPDVDVSALDGP